MDPELWESSGQPLRDKAGREAGAGQVLGRDRTYCLGVVFRSLPMSPRLRVPRKQQAALCPAPLRPPFLGPVLQSQRAVQPVPTRDLTHTERHGFPSQLTPDTFTHQTRGLHVLSLRLGNESPCLASSRIIFETFLPPQKQMSPRLLDNRE